MKRNVDRVDVPAASSRPAGLLILPSYRCRGQVNADLTARRRTAPPAGRPSPELGCCLGGEPTNTAQVFATVPGRVGLEQPKMPGSRSGFAHGLVSVAAGRARCRRCNIRAGSGGGSRHCARWRQLTTQRIDARHRPSGTTSTALRTDRATVGSTWSHRVRRTAIAVEVDHPGPTSHFEEAWRSVLGDLPTRRLLNHRFYCIPLFMVTVQAAASPCSPMKPALDHPGTGLAAAHMILPVASPITTKSSTSK